MGHRVYVKTRCVARFPGNSMALVLNDMMMV